MIQAPVFKQKMHKSIQKWIGPLEKGIEPTRIQPPVSGTYEGVDLRVLPKYICYKAALLRTQLTQQYIIIILGSILLVGFIITRVEVLNLYQKLREKEFILAPGVLDFTPAAPQNVSDSYIRDAVTDFVGQLGNFTPATIQEQYQSLAELMSPELRVKFLAESADWISKVKADSLSELLSIANKEIKTNGQGFYHATLTAKRDSYMNSEYLGKADEVIEMDLQLVPPKNGKRWYLQINRLTRQSAEAFQTKKKLGQETKR